MVKRYKRLETGYFARRFETLTKAGFEQWEAHEICGHYTTFKRRKGEGKSSPSVYLQRMIRARRLYISNLKRTGKSPEQIHSAILDLYKRKGWLSQPEHLAVEGVRYDPLKMLRSFRKSSIESGEYFRPPRKGSHHKVLTRDAIIKQGKKRARKTELQKYAEGRGRE